MDRNAPITIPELGVLTIYTGKLEIPVGKSNGSRHSVWEASENMGCNMRRCYFLLFQVSLADVDRFYNNSHSRNLAFNCFMFIKRSASVKYTTVLQ